MVHPIWSPRFFASTRGRIVDLLRRTRRTVDELAQALELTGNAVRSQLASLERDGVVRPHGLRKGGGKPSVTYELAPEIEPMLSKAYRPLFGALLESLAATLPKAQLVTLLRDAGRRLARELPPLRGEPAARAAAASAVLNDLGGLTVVDQSSGASVIRSDGCPLSALVLKRPELCKAVEVMVAELVGAPVRESCDRRGDRPRCRFEVPRSTRSHPSS
jgi:DeoR family suf operon transcriptional repressor